MGHKDPEIRKILGDLRFRAALSHALDRNQIKETIMRGTGRVAQFATDRGGPYYEEGMEEAYAAYDPDKAKQLLDELGMVDADGDGWRDRLDGEPFLFIFEFPTVQAPHAGADFAKRYWEEIGIRVDVKETSGGAYAKVRNSYENMVTMWHAAGTIAPIDPWFLGGAVANVSWNHWYNTNGEKGIEPPEWYITIRDSQKAYLAAVDEADATAAAKTAWRMQSEHLPVIGTVTGVGHPFVFSKKLGNNRPGRRARLGQQRHPGLLRPVLLQGVAGSAGRPAGHRTPSFAQCPPGTRHMLKYIARRALYMVIMVALVSIFAFVLINLPPGNYLDRLVEELEASGELVDQAELADLTRRYGLDQPLHGQYLTWMRGIVLRGDFGHSFQFNRPIGDLIAARLPFSVVLSSATLLFTFAMAIPIGIYVATHQYSVGDYSATVFGFLGLATPNFLLALVLMFVLLRLFGITPGGLFSYEYAQASWSLGKLVDLLGHLIVPVVVIGTAGTAGLIRSMRATLLDELHKAYVVTARAKGVAETRLLFRYPVRVALNPQISTVGWLLPEIVSGDAIVSVVMNLPTIGPLLLGSLLSQDMYLAGSVVLILTFLTLVGTFVSDLLLVWSDPRIRFE